MRLPIVAAAAMLCYAAYEWAAQQQAAAESDTAGDTTGNVFADTYDQISTAAEEIMNSVTGYSYAKVPTEYRDAITQAEMNYGLPDQMLARLLWQECRYKPAIISGAVRSSVGALGIAQFMPATAAELGLDPLDPYAAIDAAGRYLRSMYRQTGTWPKALAAYNWGIGNVKRKGLNVAPTETRNYFQQILDDIGLKGLYA